MFRRLLVLSLFLLAAACTVTGSDGQPVVLTASTAPGLVLAKVQAACKFYNANAANVQVVTQAIEQAIQASQNVKGTTDTVETLAAIACALLTPAPAPAPVPPLKKDG